MATLAEKLLERGIRLRAYAVGNYKITCPNCSNLRRKKSDPCLSITIDGDGAMWNCHNGCGFVGRVFDQEPIRPVRRQRSAPTKPKAPGELGAEVLAWFAARGISETVVRRNGIGTARVWMPSMKIETDCIAFPYRRAGELVNVKYRALESKAFSQVKDAEKILYGLDDIVDATTAIVVEGECDKLGLEEAGIRHVVSVPDGAPATVKAGEPAADDTKFSYLANCAAYLDRLDKIILAVDCDSAGQALETELVRRLGRERCWRVRWPDGGDVPCKDANDVLRVHGADVLRECIEHAEPYPIAGLHNIHEYAEDSLALYRDGRARGHSTGWASLDEFMTIRPGELSVVTGTPGSGKSEFIDALMVNLALNDGWRFAVASFENPPPEHIAKFAEKVLGRPFWDGPTARMTEADLERAMDWAEGHFHLLRADDEAPTIDWILSAARGAVLRHGVHGLVIDPYNEIEHHRPANQTETEYVSQLLGKVKRFAQAHGVHVWFVAHPAKMPRESTSIPAPTLYDISGSANWANKCDIGVVVHRDPLIDPTRTDIFIRKVRFKAVGKIGVISLRYDPTTGRYFEIAGEAKEPWKG